MIKKIKFIKNVGVFRDYKWPDNLPEFARKNLIYGWNYSGKTTLSRIFKSIELDSISDKGWRFELLTNEDSILTHKNLSAGFPVRVFNREYVDENFRREDVASPIFILGQENIKIKQKLEVLKERTRKLKGIEQGLMRYRGDLENRLMTGATNEARLIREALNEPNFKRPDFLKLLDIVKHKPHEFRLSEENENALKQRLKGLDVYERLQEITWVPVDLQSTTNAVNSLLQTTASQKAINELKADRKLEKWIYEGLGLHAHSETCQFCKNPLSRTRINELRAHFSEEYQKLITAVQRKISDLNEERRNTPSLPDKANFLPELRDQYEGMVIAMGNWLKWFESIIDELIVALERKLVEIENIWQEQIDLDRAKEGLRLVQAINELIKKQNEIVAQADQEIESAKNQLKLHYAASFVISTNLKSSEDQIARCESRISRAQEIQERIAESVAELEGKIRESVIGAEKLNVRLGQLLPDNPIRVTVTDDDTYIILRGSEPATNLSDGERTAITFAHYLTKLEELGGQLAKTIVFIDDPISSLDSNHIYGVYSLIKEKAEQCRQIFLSTHNSELFNLLKEEWLDHRNNGANKKDSRAYMLWRTMGADSNPKSELIDLPSTLRRFKSEYEFAFSMLFDFVNKTAPSIAEAYVIPNLLRKFLEAYLGFRNPSVRAWHRKLDLLIDEPTMQDKVAKFADDASHLQSLSQAQKHPYFMTDAKNTVLLVLQNLHDKDKEHYHALLSVIGVKECALCSTT